MPPNKDGATPMSIARERTDVPELALWLDRTHGWSSPLHFVVGEEELVYRPPALPQEGELSSSKAATLLLRSGADIHFCESRDPDDKEATSPLELARLLGATYPEGKPPANSAAELVMQAAEPWSPTNHWLFPDAARARAADLAHVGHLLARKFRGEEGVEEQSLIDVWMTTLMPMAIHRTD